MWKCFDFWYTFCPLSLEKYIVCAIYTHFLKLQFFSQSNIIVTRRTTPTTTLRTTEATTVRSGKPTRSPFDNPNRYKMPQANQQSDQVRFVNGRPYRYVHIYVRQNPKFSFQFREVIGRRGSIFIVPFPTLNSINPLFHYFSNF